MLQRKLFLINLLIFLFISTLSAFLIYYRASLIIRQTIWQNFQEVAANLEENVEARLEKEIAEAGVLAASPELKYVLTTSFEDFLKREAEEYRNIYLLDREGRALISFWRDKEHAWSQEPWWPEIVHATSPKVILGEVIPPYKIDELFLNFPIRSGETFLGVLRVELVMAEVFPAFQHIFSGKTGHAHLLTINGANLVGAGDETHLALLPQIGEVFLNKHVNQGIMLDETGKQKIIYTYTIVDSPKVERWLDAQEDLVVFVRQSLNETLQPVYHLVREVFAIWLFFFIATSIGLYYYSKKVIHPIEVLKQGVDNITLGNLDNLTQLTVDSKDEIKELADSFNDMALALHRTMVSKDYLDAVFTAMDDVVIVTDLTGRITRVNKALLRLLRYEEAELLGQSIRDIIEKSELYSEKPQPEFTLIRHRLFEEEVNLLTQAGERIGTYLRSSLIKGAGKVADEYLGIVNVGRDLRKFKLIIETLEEKSLALQTSELKYRRLIEASPLPIIISQGDRIVFGNAAFERLTGLTPAAYRELNFLDFVLADKQAEVERMQTQRLSGEVDSPFHLELVIALPSKEQRHLDLVGKLIDFEEKPAILYLLHDVTEQKEMQQYIFRRERMNAVGTLASGVAHEFNNIIGSILGYAELVQTDKKYADKLVEVVISQGERVRRITQGLLSFASRPEEQEEVVNLNYLTEEILMLLEKYLSKAGITVVKDYQTDVEMFISPSKVQQALLNILINAKEAIDERGEIALTIKKQDDNILLLVKDSGRGIPAENLPKIFDPFFSTKGAWGAAGGSGTGLGLTYAYNLVKSLGGDIKVQSQVGVGSVFTVIFPLREWSNNKETAI